MASAARVGDPSTHGGLVTGPGVSTVLIGGQMAAVMGDMHSCPIAAPGHLVSSVFAIGSTTVMIGGRPALRAMDICACGASVAAGCPNVIIGG